MYNVRKTIPYTKLQVNYCFVWTPFYLFLHNVIVLDREGHHIKWLFLTVSAPILWFSYLTVVISSKQENLKYVRFVPFPHEQFIAQLHGSAAHEFKTDYKRADFEYCITNNLFLDPSLK